VQERLALVRAVDGGCLTERWIDALQSGQVQNHDVADVPPARGDKGCPQIQFRIAKPVDRVFTGSSKRVVDEALVGRVLQRPDDPDHGEGQDDRQVEHRLIDA